MIRGWINRVLVCGATLVAAAVALAGDEALVLYVAPDGNDAWSGRSPAANRSLGDGPLATLEGARDAIRELKARQPLPAGGIVVELQGGTYRQKKAIELDERDSGNETSPIVYRARIGDQVRLVGGEAVKGWRNVTDPKVLAILPEVAAGRVLEASLTVPEADLGHVQPGLGWGASEPGLELFFGNRPMTLARWPNEGFVKMGAVVGPTPVAGTKSGACLEGIFTFDFDRPARWLRAQDVMVHGFWAHDWADQRLRVARIDTANRVITLDAEPQHHFGFRSGQWFYAYNLLSELDRPGEWYLDRASRTLYFWPPAPVDGGEPTVSMVSNLIRMNGVSNLAMRGLTLEVCRETAVVIAQGTGIRIVGCTIRNAGGWAIELNGRRCAVVGCDISDIGSGGVAMSGGDRITLTAGELTVDNCQIFRFGRWNPINKPGVRVDGVGNRVTHCLLHDSPHAALAWSGNDHVFEFNEFHSVVQSANDAGVLYAGYSPSMRGNTIRFNYLHDVHGFEGRGCNGIYLDDMFCSATIFGNIFCRVPRAVFIGGGHDNVVDNNIFVDCAPGVHADARMLTWEEASNPIMKQRLEEMPFREEPWRSRYPELLSYLDGDFAEPRNNLVTRNISWRGAWDSVEARARPGVRFVDNLVGVNPRFVDERCRNFRLRSDSPAWRLGFKDIPIESIGLYRSEERASWPVVHDVQPRPRHSLKPSMASVRRLYEWISVRTWLVRALAAGALCAAVVIHLVRLSRLSWPVVVAIVCVRWVSGVVALVLLAEVFARYVSLPSLRFVCAGVVAAVSLAEAIDLARIPRSRSRGTNTAKFTN